MKTLLTMFVLVGVGVAQDKKEDKKSDKDLLQGSWKVTKFAANDMEFPADALDQLPKFVVKDEKYTFKMDEDGEEGKLKLDAVKKPKELDLDITAGEDKDKKQLAIYEINGDELKICASTAGSTDRPKEFSGKEGQIFITLKREKKDK